jgi:hypothetical protein
MSDFHPRKRLNLTAAKYHDDTAALHRHMIEYRILERDGEGVYWVVTNLIILPINILISGAN